ncbi:protein translocase subunit SecD [Enterobacteriaceae endosymbiont of Donacia cinerea]|uniref:protein translocase subunit SecD n=1 Tax=Enterobacteriaceae endosymbiont of Donacia cinerea TaxID=2675774 RepID=UPI001449A019|nr:protein translocase subunit SecD [Enterobacteriaceae endosymbiont of Donacia cinerea]QJC34053.1 protein translocase subunit SecD [Enterobacteriaceae endosymbiont of Donacia cinerea]
MLNKYNIKQYIFIISLFLFGIIYSLPNIYNDIPSIKICLLKNKNFNIKVFNNINKIIRKNNLIYIKIYLYNKSMEIIFNNIQNQLNAYKIIKNKLNKNNSIISINNNFLSSIPKWLLFIKAKPIMLGLDLKGGVYFLIQINNNYFLKKLKEKNIEDIKKIINIKNIFFIKNEKLNNFNYKIFFKNLSYRDKVFSFLKNQKNNNIIINYKIINNNGIRIYLDNNELEKIKNSIIENSINVLRNRVNQMGITNAIVQKRNSNNIIVELPGTQNIKKAKDILGSTSTIEFHLINEDNFNNKKNNFLLIDKEIIIDGTYIINANYNKNEYNKPQVNVFLNNKGNKIFSNFTKKHIGKNVVTLLVSYINNKKNIKNKFSVIKKIEVLNIAKIKTQIKNSFSIIGFKNLQEAKKLTLLLKSGKLNTPINIIKEEIIEPLIGRKNIMKGIKAFFISIIICIIFMILYYKIFGVIAVIALFLNILLMISLFSLLPNFTLTMSGIVGIILTLAIAINYNIIINERIKEEIKKILSIQKIIYFGYKGALYSILDSSIINIITTVILYIFGSREMQGFAITTFIGIITSILTSVFITKIIINFLYKNKKIKKLSI